MDKKTLKQLTTKIYVKYGFIKKGKYYYLDLEDILICSGFDSMHGITYLAYNFSVKGAHKEEEYKPNDMFDGFDSFQQQIYFNKDAQGYHKKEICVEEWSEDYYSSKLDEQLHYYFDPYRQYGLEWVKKVNSKIGLVHSGELIVLSKVAKDYLGVESGDMKQVFDLKKIDQLGSIFKDMKLLHDMRVTEIINKDDCLIFEYENNDLNDSLFIEYNLDRFKKIIIKYNYDEINITDQFVFVHNLRRGKYYVFRINEFINFIKKKKIKLYWVDYFLSTSEIYLEFIDKFGWDGYIRFDLQLKTIEYEWIEK